ncbi:hypothetical protein E3O32_06050 [Cryobacterium mannosilyticum]|uniref:Low temperature requirement protein A n=1 Tax=Cryobacterium mannosilyticum TaxID=1259190 RepID=A0A4R8W9Y5_9MICO|nr:hypothetical protein E3O32_06050 [Cryobacterium mannosilyticum]
MSNQPGGAPLSWASAAAFRRHFWQPPRAHGDVIQGREVSFLELFYDLVYVVVISQAAHHLSGDVTWAGVGRFAIVFGLIWLAWVNGATYHDLHGRSDGRTRSYVFLQMAVFGLLAVFTGEATAGDGPAFAAVYSVYLFLLAWLWYTVRRQDDPELRSRATPYIVGVVVSAALVGASALLPDTARLAVWAVVVVGWLAGQHRHPGLAERGHPRHQRQRERVVDRTVRPVHHHRAGRGGGRGRQWHRGCRSHAERHRHRDPGARNRIRLLVELLRLRGGQPGEV